MTFTKTMSIRAAHYVAPLIAVIIAMPLAAQAQTASSSGTLSRYILKDLGTAGGPNSDIPDVTHPINNQAMVTNHSGYAACRPLRSLSALLR